MEPSTGAGVTVEALVAAVTATWAADEGLATQTVARMGEVAARFTRRAAATGATHITDVEECGGAAQLVVLLGGHEVCVPVAGVLRRVRVEFLVVS